MWECPRCKGHHNLNESCRCGYNIESFGDVDISALLVEVEIKPQKDKNQSISPDKRGLRNIDNSIQL